MKALLENRFAPRTYSFGFLETDFDMVNQETVAWLESLEHRLQVEAGELALEKWLDRLMPLSMPHRKILLLATESQWTAYFDNGSSGGDPSSFIGYMATRLKCRGLAVTCIPHIRANKNGKEEAGSYTVRFVVYGPEATDWLNIERSISAVNDYDKWTFNESGTAQPFEEKERYKAKAVKERFHPEMLEQYCAALNIRLFDAEFYGPRGVLITDSGRVAA